MHIFIAGGTGSIGAAIVPALLRRGHTVAALARSERSARRLSAMGATAIPGDLWRPDQFLTVAAEADGIVYAATDFSADMEAMDQCLLDALLPRLARNARGQRLIYTGGCWLYGATGDRIATESTPFDPLPAFAWMVPAIGRVLAAPGIHPIVIHPAMVYEGTEGVFARFAEDARSLGRVRVIGGVHTRWPLVHRHDLAALYVLALERSGPGESYNGASAAGVPAGSVAQEIARRFGANDTPETRDTEEAAAALGEWARGYAMDQQMSGEKARRVLGWQPRWHRPLADLA